jgi:hypothetical protein
LRCAWCTIFQAASVLSCRICPAIIAELSRCAPTLRRLEAVRAVKINLLTGSVLIEHNGLCASRDAIMLALENAGYRLTRQTSVQANEVRQHWPSKVAALSANAVIGWIVERAIFNALAAVA